MSPSCSSELPGGDIRVIAHAGADADAARTVARLGVQGGAYGNGSLIVESIGREPDGPRAVAVASARPLGHHLMRRVRMMAAVARQGFDLCGARDRPTQASDATTERPLEPLVPGFVCASAAMHRVVDQIQRLQGNDLTVLITGESGTGKELVARAIHVGSPRSAAVFLPYNCTTTTRELADSQLFGHRRGAFTGAVSDQPGLVRTAAGGTLFLDEVGDLPLDVQPKLLRFLEQGEIMPVGETAPQRVDVRVITATNADLEQRVAEGKFREDLYYRLSVIRIHVPPLRQRTRGDSAPEHVLPARGVRAARQAGRATELGRCSICSRSTGGQATSASCATKSSAPWPWRRRAASSNPSTCRPT